MPGGENNNKIIAGLLAIIILIAVITLIYVNLPADENDNVTTDDTTEETNDEQDEEPEEDIFSIVFNDTSIQYSLSELEGLELYTANATLIKVGWLPEIKTEGPNKYTGVKITTLLEQVNLLPENYTINVTSSDGWTTGFIKSQIQGNVNIYNETGVIIDNSGATMILAYKIDGEYFTEEDTGPLRVVFCHEYMTASNIWPKMVNSIEIIEQ